MVARASIPLATTTREFVWYKRGVAGSETADNWEGTDRVGFSSQEDFAKSPMAYVERGTIKSKRSIWRLKTMTDFFWAIVSIIGVFFSTMFSMEKSDSYRKGSGAGKKWDSGGPGGPRGGPFGGPRGPPRGLDNVRGIDHSSLPACGSCCG